MVLFQNNIMRYAFLVFLISATLISGCVSQETKSCGSPELTSKLPDVMYNLEMMAFPEDFTNHCSDIENQLKIFFPNISGYATTEYESQESQGTIAVVIIKFDNESDARETASILRDEAQRKPKRDAIMQIQGTNKILWVSTDGNVQEILWKSQNHIIDIDNNGMPFIPKGLISDLLSKFPSDDDVMLKDNDSVYLVLGLFYQFLNYRPELLLLQG